MEDPEDGTVPAVITNYTSNSALPIKKARANEHSAIVGAPLAAVLWYDFASDTLQVHRYAQISHKAEGELQEAIIQMRHRIGY